MKSTLKVNTDEHAMSCGGQNRISQFQHRKLKITAQPRNFVKVFLEAK